LGPPGNPPWDDTELIEVAVDMTLALPDDLELVVDTDRRVLEAPWYEIFP
jgi:hypothetical protein